VDSVLAEHNINQEHDAGKPMFRTDQLGVHQSPDRSPAALGHPVFATARKERDLEALADLENVTPVRLGGRGLGLRARICSSVENACKSRRLPAVRCTLYWAFLNFKDNIC